MLTSEQLFEFNEKGFIVVRGLLSDEDLSPAEDDVSQRLDELASYLEVNTSDDIASINSKMMDLEKSSPGASLTFVHSPIIDSGLFKFWSSPKILDIAQSILGADIDGHPVFKVRPKPPGVGLFEVPWHQDSAYLVDGAQESPQLTFWVPLMDATADNGCLEMAVGEHLDGEKRHVAAEAYGEFGNSSWYLELEGPSVEGFSTEICEMKRGDVILFTQLTPHRSLPNLSTSCRWSIDMRYVKGGCFVGTSQAPIPFRRADPELDVHVESSKREFQLGQRRMDRGSWRHKIDRPVFRDRWV